MDGRTITIEVRLTDLRIQPSAQSFCKDRTQASFQCKTIWEENIQQPLEEWSSKFHDSWTLLNKPKKELSKLHPCLSLSKITKLRRLCQFMVKWQVLLKGFPPTQLSLPGLHSPSASFGKHQTPCKLCISAYTGLMTSSSHIIEPWQLADQPWARHLGRRQYGPPYLEAFPPSGRREKKKGGGVGLQEI